MIRFRRLNFAPLLLVVVVVADTVDVERRDRRMVAVDE